MAEESSLPKRKSSKKHIDHMGYRFMGWYADPQFTKRINPSGKLPGTTTFYDKWVPILYPVRYVLYGAKNDPRNPNYVTVETGVLKLYPPKKEGYVFDGWIYNGRKIRTLPEGQTKTVVLKASFKETEHIHFETNGGGTLKSAPILVNQSSKILTPMKIGCTFEGWYYDEDFTQPYLEEDQITEECTLYARWTPTEYEIRYNLDGGTNSSKNPTSYTYFSKTIPLRNATKPGYVFEGWYDIRGRRINMIQAKTIGNYTLTARFTKEREE
ncbi:MAG: InlB B-repeat-containing protein [Bacillota bacterium]|nr:InlB B-repeat-containing protein [Bacillota bacterium]